MSLLIDSSVWIDFFRGEGLADQLEQAIEENLAAINDLILTELIPPLHLRNQHRIIALLKDVERIPMSIDWNHLVQMQTTCLRHGINGMGIPDLMIAQNALQNDIPLLTSDRHFARLSRHLPLRIHGD